jgi:translation elongation factor EF-1beta
MGKALIVFRVFADPENVEKVAAALKTLSEGECKEVRREPIGFGIEVIRAGYVIPDKVDGAMDKLEDAVRKVDGVNEVEVEAMTLIDKML